MGDIREDYVIKTGKTPSGQIMFVDLSPHESRRVTGLFSVDTKDKVDVYEGNILVSNVSGAFSPTSYPVSFSVKHDEQERAQALALSACAVLAEKMISPDWNGQDKILMSTTHEMSEYIKNFSEHSSAEKKVDKRVIRTSLSMDMFLPKKTNQNKKKSLISPSPDSIGIKIGAGKNGFDSLADARKFAGPADKIGFGPIRAPDIDMEAAKSSLSAVSYPEASLIDFYGGAGINRNVEDDNRFGDRQQAAKSFPILSGMIADTMDMRRAVDNREALQPLLLEYTGLTKGALKRLSKIRSPFDEAGAGHDNVQASTDQLGINRVSGFVVRGGMTLGTALSHLKELPPDWTPDNDEAWSAYADILGGIAIPLSKLTGKSVKDLMSTSKGDWVGYKKTLAKAADIPVEDMTRERMATLSGEVMMMADSLARTAIMPMAFSVMKRAGQSGRFGNKDFVDNLRDLALTVSVDVIMGKSKAVAATLLEAERKYISRDTAINALSMGVDGEAGAEENEVTDKEREMGDLAGNKAFPVVRETWTATNGYMVVPFRNEKEMIAEGALMGHCVGTFHKHHGSNGTYHYFAVYHPDTMNDPTARGTLRLEAIRPGAKIKEVEFRSYHNQAISQKCRDAFKEWTQTFLQEDIDIAGARMDEWRQWRKDNGLDAGIVQKTPEEVFQNRTGVSVDSRQTLNSVWDEWSRNVLSGWSSDNPEVMFKEKSVRDLIQKISPATAEFLMREAEEKRAEANTPSM